MSDKSTDEEQSRPAPSGRVGLLRPPRRDRGPLVAMGVAGALVLAGIVLIARSPRAPAPPPPAVLTSADVGVRTEPTPPASHALPPSTSAVPAAREEPRFTPVFRVASMKSDPGIDVIEVAIGKHPIAGALVAAGIEKGEARRLVQALETARTDKPSGKDILVAARERGKGAVVAFEYVTSPTDIWQGRSDAGDPDRRLIVKKLQLFVEHRPIAAGLSVTVDLRKAVAAAGLHDEIVAPIDDALDGHLDLASIRPGVRLRVVGTEEWVEGVLARHRVDAVEVIPKDGPARRLYYYEREPGTSGSAKRAPHAGTYDAKGQQPYLGSFRSPVPLARVTSRFNPRRMHPVLHVVMPHNGVDFGGSTGTPVYASAAGSVTSAGNSGPCGNMVELAHAGGLTTAYCHLSRFAAGLHAGQKVEARQLVGYIGQTGRATGPHLHFAAKRGGQFIDPLALKMDGVRVLPHADREAFAARRTELDARLDGVAMPSPVGAEMAKDEDDDKPGDE